MFLMGLNYLLFILTLFLREIYFFQLRREVYIYTTVYRKSTFEDKSKSETRKVEVSSLFVFYARKL